MSFSFRSCGLRLDASNAGIADLARFGAFHYRSCSVCWLQALLLLECLVVRSPLAVVVPLYKLLLCLRYLRTRWIALVSIVSVTLGVATMIVVNAVMAGFTHEMQDRIHGILGDLVVDVRSLDGASDASAHMDRIDRVAGHLIEGMSPTAQVPAMLGYTVGDQYISRQVNLIGVDPDTYGQVSDFRQYLQHPENRKELSFGLREIGYDTIDHQADDPSRVVPRTQMETAGWERRRRLAYWEKRNALPAKSERNHNRVRDFETESS